MTANGVEAGHPGVQDQAQLLQELRALGADVAEVEAVRFPYPLNLREEFDHFESRSYSETWDIPDTIFEASMKELHAWMTREYGELDQEVENEVRCVIHVARFEG